MPHRVVGRKGDRGGDGEGGRDRGYDYLAICDHTTNVRVVPGLTGDDVRRQGDEIAAANETLAPFRVVRGIECDILPDGSLDLEDAVLAELDWVQISLHAGQRRLGPELTRIVCEAMRNPFARALSHPKGRILNHRPENALDLEAVYEVAIETSVALEINGLPDRLDLSSRHATEALAAGVKLVLSSDAHSTLGLANMELAVATARRAGAAAEQIVNAGVFPLDAPDLLDSSGSHRRHNCSETRRHDMAVARVTEISSTSTTSFEDAIKQGLERANATLRNVKSAWIKEQQVRLDGGSISEYQVNMLVTFILDD